MLGDRIRSRPLRRSLPWLDTQLGGGIPAQKLLGIYVTSEVIEQGELVWKFCLDLSTLESLLGCKGGEGQLCPSPEDVSRRSSGFSTKPVEELIKWKFSFCRGS